MARSRKVSSTPAPASSLAFLLSQVGAHSAARFAERLAPLKLTPPHVGILGVINESDALSQQALGEKLGVFPSRLVGLLDELEARGLVERRDIPTDRRSYALHLTKTGRNALHQIGRIGREHQQALCAALDASEQGQLAGFLTRIVAQQGLTPGVHPGFRRLGAAEPK
jgi:DNA-binding MarR family transcriptional regulator